MKKIYITLTSLLVMLSMLYGCGASREDTRFFAVSDELKAIAEEIDIESPMEIDDSTLKALFNIDAGSVHSYYGIMSLVEANNNTVLYIYTDRDKTDKIMDKMREYSEVFAGEAKYHIFRVIDRCFLIQAEYAEFEELEARITELAR